MVKIWKCAKCDAKYYEEENEVLGDIGVTEYTLKMLMQFSDHHHLKTGHNELEISQWER